MQVGLLSLGDLITDPVTGRRATPAERHRSLVEQAVLAEQVGFTSVHLGEHHFCEYILSSPAIVLAAIAERTSTMRLSTGVTLGVHNDPVRVAEDYATVDLLSGGRVEPVIGRGTFFPTRSPASDRTRVTRAPSSTSTSSCCCDCGPRRTSTGRASTVRRSTGSPSIPAPCSARGRRCGSAAARRASRWTSPPGSACG